MQLKTIFISSTKYIYAKTLTVSERTFKIKAISHLGHFSTFSLHRKLFADKGFCAKTRLCKISENTNTYTFIKFILENP